MIAVSRLMPDGSFNNGLETGGGAGVAASEQGHVVTAADKLLRERKDDPLGSAVPLGRNGLEWGRNLSDSHNAFFRYKRVADCAWCNHYIGGSASSSAQGHDSTAVQWKPNRCSHRRNSRASDTILR